MEGRSRGAGGACAVTVRDSTPADIAALATQLDQPTHAELVALTGLPLLDTLCLYYSESDEMFTVEDADGGVLALGGVAPDDDGSPSAAVWLVCAPQSRRTPKSLIRTLRALIQEVGCRYGLLYGFVDARNAKRQRWLETLGFRVNTDEQKSLGYLGLPFFQFLSTSN